MLSQLHSGVMFIIIGTVIIILSLTLSEICDLGTCNSRVHTMLADLIYASSRQLMQDAWRNCKCRTCHPAVVTDLMGAPARFQPHPFLHRAR